MVCFVSRIPQISSFGIDKDERCQDSIYGELGVSIIIEMKNYT